MNISEIRAYFEGVELPEGSIELSSGELVIDIRKMIESHLEYLTENKGNKAFLPYYNRIITVINHIKNKKINEKT